MPTYLTPGVYVEEIPSANKPIEGVGTAVAAFVGLAPGGPVNTPMRISNWTQFAKIYGDPVNPDNGPFMEGSYLAHSIYGFFQNGGSVCWVVRVGSENGSVSARRGAAGRVRQERGGVPRGGARRHRRPGDRRGLRGARGGHQGRRRDVQAGREGRRGDGVLRGPLAQEGSREHRDEGQRRLEADQDRGRLGVAARDAASSRAPTRSPRRRRSRPRSSPRTSRATSRGAPAWAASPRSTRSRCS